MLNRSSLSRSSWWFSSFDEVVIGAILITQGKAAENYREELWVAMRLEVKLFETVSWSKAEDLVRRLDRKGMVCAARVRSTSKLGFSLRVYRFHTNVNIHLPFIKDLSLEQNILPFPLHFLTRSPPWCDGMRRKLCSSSV